MLTMQFILLDSPYSFMRCSISAINVLFDFVTVIMQCDSATVTAFVKVFIDVFHGSERYSAFHIYVALKMKDAEWTVWHNPPIVQHVSSHWISSTIVWSRIPRIAFMIHDSVILEGLGIAMHAFIVSHAWSFWVQSSTGTMRHTALDDSK